ARRQVARATTRAARITAPDGPLPVPPRRRIGVPARVLLGFGALEAHLTTGEAAGVAQPDRRGERLDERGIDHGRCLRDAAQCQPQGRAASRGEAPPGPFLLELERKLLGPAVAVEPPPPRVVRQVAADGPEYPVAPAEVVPRRLLTRQQQVVGLLEDQVPLRRHRAPSPSTPSEAVPGSRRRSCRRTPAGGRRGRAAAPPSHSCRRRTAARSPWR